MSRQATDPKAEPKTEKERQAEKKHLNDVLDEGLEETFPASDTPAVVRPGHGIPTKKPTKSED